MWWKELPLGVVAKFAESLPRLQAEEALSELQIGAAASGGMRKPDFDSYIRRLQRQVNAGRRPKKVKASPEQLKAMGIEIEGG